MIKAMQKIKAADAAAWVSAICITAAIVILFGYADDNALRILLWPHAKATEVFYNIKMSFIPGTGYIAQGADFAIGRGCFGANFIALMFCMLTCSFVQKFRGIQKAIWIGFSLLISAAAGILFSIIRIIGSVPLLDYNQFTTLHTGIGAAVYFIALVLAYFLTNKILGGSKYERTE